MTTFNRARRFMGRNARPLDIARWRYHFEYGAIGHVLSCLAMYQNEDGGFGHALEADSWNPESTPIQTWAAAGILREINLRDKGHPIVQGILNYLGNDPTSLGDLWLNVTPTTALYPHAPWWGEGKPSLNPSASLAGFILVMGHPKSELYQRAQRIAALSVDYLMKEDIDDAHLLTCMVELFDALRLVPLEGFDLMAIEARLQQLVKKLLERDQAKWDSAYCVKPSSFFDRPSSVFYPTNRELAEAECDFILRSQNEDGSWSIPWTWQDYPREWAISELWWKGHVTIKNLLVLKHYNRI